MRHDVARLQHSPYVCVFKYARAVKQKVWNEAETGERRYVRVRLARLARVRLLRHALPISLLILRSFAVYDVAKRDLIQSSAQSLLASQA